MSAANAGTGQIIVTAGTNGGFGGGAEGTQRQAVLQAAADQYEQILDVDVNVVVEVDFESLFCDASSATLGSAGPTSASQYYTSPVAIWTVAALSNNLFGADVHTGAEISASFNSNLNGSASCLGGRTWYYGLDHNPGFNEVDLLEVALHEFAHGFGFLTFMDLDTGELLQGDHDMYEWFLYDTGTNMWWSDMTDFQRKLAAFRPQDTIWGGDKGFQFGQDMLDVGTRLGGYPLVYTPVQVEPGSSVSHFDTTLSYIFTIGDGGQNELMEPFSTGDFQSHVTRAVWCDMTWGSLIDYDSDGTSDCFDDYLISAAADTDTDGDGLADDWVSGSGCSGSKCDGITLDGDDDNDGVPDAVDIAPLDDTNTNEVDLPIDSTYKGEQHSKDRLQQ